jgi:hypothetical protein
MSNSMILYVSGRLILNNEILPGYTVHRKDCNNNMRGAGVLVAVRNELLYYTLI